MQVQDINFAIADNQKTCVICHAVFTERENTGALKCSQHAGRIINGRFTCCNFRTPYTSMSQFYENTTCTKQRGCVRCDHRTTYTAFGEENGVIMAPERYIYLLPLNEKSMQVVVNANGAPLYLLIHRYDAQKSSDNVQLMSKHYSAVDGMVDKIHNLGTKTINYQ